MNILILLNRDLASTVALNYLLPEIAHHEIAILVSERVGNNKKRKPQALVDLSVVEQGILNDLISNQQQGELLTIDGLAKKYHYPVRVENRINQASSIEQLAKFAPDLIVSVRYGVILKAEVIGTPAYGVINLHSGTLPAYRGVMATFWAMLKGERSIGTTLHYIDDATIDTGRIIGHTHMPVDDRESYLDHVLKIYADGCDLIIDTINIFERGDVPETKDQQSGGEYFTFPDESDLKDFADKGFKLFDLKAALSMYKRFKN